MDVLQVLCGVLLGGAGVYAVLSARTASETAEDALATAEEGAESQAVYEARQNALDKRLWACERAVDDLCVRTALGVKRKGE